MGLQVIDVSQPTNLLNVSDTVTLGITDGVVLMGKYAYLADGPAGLQIIDISRPSSPVGVGTCYLSGYAFDVALAENYAYVVNQVSVNQVSKSQLHVVDVSNPGGPVRVGTWETSGLAYGVAVDGNYGYLANGDRGLQVIDIGNPADPVLVGSYDTGGDAWGVAIAGKYAYVADWTAGLQVIDVSDPTRPVRVGGCDTSGFAQRVAIRGSYAFTADGSKGLQVIDISNPANPVRVGGRDTKSVAYSVNVAGNYLYLADYGGGLLVFDLSNPANPEQVGEYGTTGVAMDVAVDGNYAYVADHSGGLAVLRLDLPGTSRPHITQSPQDQAQPVGTELSLSVTASGTSPLAYQWRHDGIPLPKATNQVLNLTLLQPTDAGLYDVLVTNAYGSSTSATALLTITGEPPVFTQELQDQRIRAGEPLVLSAPAIGWEPIQYQWSFNDAGFPGATQFELSIASVQLTNSGRYYLMASNFFGVSTSAVAVVTVFNPLQVLTSKTTRRIPIGQSLSLQVAVEGDGPFQYQWQINGEAIPGATNQTYSITNARPENGGSYRVVVANDAEVVAADIAEVIVTVPPAPLGDQFADRVWLAGTDGVIRSSNEWATVQTNEPRHAGKTGGHSVWYSWTAPSQGNLWLSTAGSAFDTLLGVYTGSELSQLQPVASDEDQGGYSTSQTRFAVEAGVEYQVAIDGFAGAVGAVVLAWTFEPTPDVLPQIVEQPRSQMVPSGATVTLRVVAEATNLRYQWDQNGLALAGATYNVLVLTNVGADQVGAYQVAVVNATGTQTNRSQLAFIEVYQAIEGQGRDLELGQDKLEDLMRTGAQEAFTGRAALLRRLSEADGGSSSCETSSAYQSYHSNALASRELRPPSPVNGGAEGPRWQVVRLSGLPPVSGYTLSRWGDTRYDTTQVFENTSGGVISGHSRWQALVIPFAGICTLSTAGSAFDTVLEVVRIEGAKMVRVAYDDNSGADGQSSWVQFEVAAGREYYVRVAGVGSAKGKYQLTEVLEVPQQFREWEYQAGEGYVFTLQVPKGIVFRIEGSTDLRDWEGILSTTSATGTYVFRHSDHQRYGHRFYRAILLP